MTISPVLRSTVREDPASEGGLCPCFYFDHGPAVDEDVPTCACGHVEDEHDETGACQVEMA